MARGRMVSNGLGRSSRKFAALAEVAGKRGEFAQGLYLLLIPAADDFGRLDGDAWTIKHDIWSTSPRPVVDFEAALAAMERVGLLRRWVTDGHAVAEIQGWEIHQTGLHKRTKSRYPNPPANQPDSVNFPELPGTSGELQEVPASRARAELNRTELNLTRTAEAAASAARASEPETPDDEPAAVNGKAVRTFSDAFLALYAKHRHGAHYLWRGVKDTQVAKKLLATYGHDRLLQLVEGLLLTDDDWIAGTDRGMGILAVRASWLDARIAEWEASHAS